MDIARTIRLSRTRELCALLSCGSVYWLTLNPRARAELRGWERHARLIPDPVLRAQALENLRREGIVSEGAAFFATLAPRARRAQLVAVLVAFQVIYDYLDTISEQLVPGHLRNSRQLHRALTSALSPGHTEVDYYRHHPHKDDGGYLDALVVRCCDSLLQLPSAEVVAPLARRVAWCCNEGQSRTHVARFEGVERLADWCSAKAGPGTLRWWEYAASTVSSLTVHALLAAAADPRTTGSEADRIDAAYSPYVCPLNTFLDSLIDREHDAGADEHSYISYYATRTETAERMEVLAGRASRAVRRLRRGARHTVILAGIAGFYLSAPEAMAEFAAPVKARVIDRIGPIATPVVVVMRMRRRWISAPRSAPAVSRAR